MKIIYDILLALALIVAIVYTVLVLIVSKGDAMSGGGSGIRTTFKGKAGLDDIMAKVLLGLGGGFMALMLLIDVLANHMSAK